MCKIARTLDDVIDLLPAPLVRTVRFNGAQKARRLQVSEPTAASV